MLLGAKKWSYMPRNGIRCHEESCLGVTKWGIFFAGTYWYLGYYSGVMAAKCENGCHGTYVAPFGP